jgi:hypothetical protein
VIAPSRSPAGWAAAAGLAAGPVSVSSAVLTAAVTAHAVRDMAGRKALIW